MLKIRELNLAEKVFLCRFTKLEVYCTNENEDICLTDSANIEVGFRKPNEYIK